MTWSSYHSHISCQGNKVNEMRPQIKSEGLSIPAQGLPASSVEGLSAGSVEGLSAVSLVGRRSAGSVEGYFR